MRQTRCDYCEELLVIERQRVVTPTAPDWVHDLANKLDFCNTDCQMEWWVWHSDGAVVPIDYGA